MAIFYNQRIAFWPFGVAIVLFSAFLLTSAGTSSVGRVTHSNFTSYNGFVQRKNPVPTVAEARSVHDHHGRTLILKSLILAPLALVVFILLLVLLIPIPVISSPIVGTGRSSTAPSSYYKMELAKQIFTSEECVERVSCELSRISRSFESTAWIPSSLEKLLLRNGWSARIVRGLKAKSEPSCRQFTCSPANTIKRSLKL